MSFEYFSMIFDGKEALEEILSEYFWILEKYLKLQKLEAKRYASWGDHKCISKKWSFF